MLVTQQQYDTLTVALGHTPSDWEQKLYLRLSLYLNRDPVGNEIVNMATDTNLNMWVLTGQ